MIELINDVAKRTQLRYEKEGGNLKDILAEELTKEAQKKSRKLTDQSKASDHENLFNSIIHQGEDIDNNQVFNVETGKTIRDL